MSRVSMPACTFGDCREGQIPRSLSGLAKKKPSHVLELAAGYLTGFAGSWNMFSLVELSTALIPSKRFLLLHVRRKPCV